MKIVEEKGKIENKDSEDDNNKSQKEAGKSNIAGLVINAETKEAVENASLTFALQDGDSTKETITTDNSGAFKLQLTPGKYVVTVTADDYEEKEIEFEVKEGKNYSEEEFEVTLESEVAKESETIPDLEQGTGKFVLQKRITYG